MFQDLFVMHLSIAEKITRTILVYALIVVLLRLTGKRGLTGMSTLDLVVTFLLSNVVQNAVIGEDNSLLGGTIGAVTLVVVNAGVNRLTATSALAERILQGTSTTLITDGQLDEQAARRMSIRPADVQHAVRLQSGNAVSEVESGSLEPNGQLVITLKPGDQGMNRSDLAVLLARLDAIDARLSSVLVPPSGRPATDPDRPGPDRP